MHPSKATIFLFCLMLSGLSLVASAQPSSPPDYAAIKAAIGDQASPYYYPALLTRFEQGDSTMTWQEKRHLYYGASFQPSFSVINTHDFSDSLRTIVRQDELKPGDAEKLVRFGDSVLKADPFEIDALKYQAYGYKKLGNTDLMRRNVNRIYILAEAMLSSGNGKDQENAIHVNRVPDEYDLMEFLEVPFGGEQALIDGHYDRLKLGKNDMGWEYMWFDVQRSFARMAEMFENLEKDEDSKPRKKRKSR